MKRSLQIVLLLIASVIAGIGQSPEKPASWESKPIDQWDKQDVENILLRSAWSQAIEGRNVITGAGLDIVAPHRVGFTLRSSALVRYALIRQQQLKENYDAMDAKEKADFNRKYKTTLDCPACDSFYIVAVQGNGDLLGNAVLVNARASNIYLSNEKGEKRKLAKFTPRATGATEALFYFPRLDESKQPLISPENKKLTFNFEYRSGDDGVIKSIERVSIRVSDITRDGQVIF